MAPGAPHFCSIGRPSRGPDSRSKEGWMNRQMTFGSHYLLGFQHLERLLERTAKAGDSYPPYNIEELQNDGIRITLAVAGFSQDASSASPKRTASWWLAGAKL